LDHPNDPVDELDQLRHAGLESLAKLLLLLEARLKKSSGLEEPGTNSAFNLGLGLVRNAPNVGNLRRPLVELPLKLVVKPHLLFALLVQLVSNCNQKIRVVDVEDVQFVFEDYLDNEELGLDLTVQSKPVNG